MGYRGGARRVQFQAYKVSERKAAAPVMVSHTRERQEALVAAPCMHGKTFLMGGEHLTLDDMFKVVAVNRWIEEAMEREKEKKSRIKYHTRCDAPIPILFHFKLIEKSTSHV
jgi:hypothetical protein